MLNNYNRQIYTTVCTGTPAIRDIITLFVSSSPFPVKFFLPLFFEHRVLPFRAGMQQKVCVLLFYVFLFIHIKCSRNFSLSLSVLYYYFSCTHSLLFLFRNVLSCLFVIVFKCFSENLVQLRINQST